MKKLLCLLLCAIFILSLCACEKAPVETTGSTVDSQASQIVADDTTGAPGTNDAADDSIDSEILRLPMVAISMPVIQEDTVAEDGTVIFSHIYQDASLIAPDADPAEKLVLNLLNQIDGGQSHAQEIAGWATEYYDPEELWYSYFYQLLYNPMRVDEKVLSLFGSEIAYSGGVHPNQICVSATFDMVSGELLQLDDILIDKSAATAFSQLIIEDLTANKDEYQLYDGYASVMNERFGGMAANWKDQTDWYFSNNGLCVFFSPYDIAPYVSGRIIVEVPYDQLSGIVKDDFLPPELPVSSGQISIALAQDVDLEQYNQFAEAILNPDGERFVLYSDDLVTNVKLDQGSWSEDGTVFTVDSTVFIAHTLCNGDAIMVQSQIPDTMPNLRLTYESGGETFTLYITQSSKDGTMLFVDADIQ
ncbi:MAG: DUF3298 domain-containing protein [Oscillospiraceae bacterium]|nr:DUF3298 domain-containing protein [Oscillospiraceae bacterium]